AAVRIFRVFQVPQWTAACNHRKHGKVICWRWRASGPLQCPRIPGVIAGHFPLEIRPDQVPYENQNCDALDKRSIRNDQVHCVPPAAGLVGVNAARHAEQSGEVHGVERQMESDHEEPEVPFAQSFAQHSSGELRVPVVKRAEEREKNSAHDHVMKVRHNKIRIAKLPIKRCRGQHDAGKAGDQKLKEKSDAEEHRNFELDAPAPHRAQPVEYFDSGKNTNEERSDSEKAVGVRVHPDRKHVMRPDTQTHEGDANRGPDHDGITEYRLAGKYRNILRHESEAGNNEDVHLGMSEYPEKVHPKDGRSACLRVEEVPSEISIDQQHDLSRR